MRISVICEGCGARHDVDEAHAGRQGKCPHCGAILTVPAVPAPEEPDVYAMGEPVHAAPSTFVRTPARPDPERSGAPRRPKPIPKPSRRERERESSGWDLSTLRRSLPIVLGVAVVLALVAAVVPGGLKVVGTVVTIAGLIISTYGYATGAYIAFTEDSLYGILYLLIPFYTAYYFLSRWEEMRSRLAILIVGWALLAVGGWALETAQARSEAAEPEKVGALR